MCEENAGPPPSLPPPLRGHIAEGQSLSPDTKAGGRDVEVRDHVKLVLNEVLEREREREGEGERGSDMPHATNRGFERGLICHMIKIIRLCDERERERERESCMRKQCPYIPEP